MYESLRTDVNLILGLVQSINRSVQHPHAPVANIPTLPDEVMEILPATSINSLTDIKNRAEDKDFARALVRYNLTVRVLP